MENSVVVTDGKNFGTYFTCYYQYSPTYGLAVNNNDLIQKYLQSVVFNSNGGSGPLIAPVYVIAGTRLTILQKPSMDGITKTGYINDGEWYASTYNGTDYDYTLFVFGDEGTVINSYTSLLIKWIPAEITFNTDAELTGSLNMEYDNDVISVNIAQNAGGNIVFKIVEDDIHKLPDGLTFNSDGTIEGVPTKAGKFNFAVIATNQASGLYAVKVFTITIAGTTSTGTMPQIKIEVNTMNSIILTFIEGAEYSIDGENWQDSNIFTNLDSDKEYTFKARIKNSTESINIHGSTLPETSSPPSMWWLWVITGFLFIAVCVLLFFITKNKAFKERA